MSETEEKDKVVENEEKNEQENVGTEESETLTEGKKEEAPTSENKQQEEEVEVLVPEMNVEEKEKSSDQKEEKASNEQGENFKSTQNQTQLLDDTKYFVDISRTNIPFGKNVLFPGSIEEVDVSIGLKDQSLDENQDGKPFMLRVIAKCNNPQFDALDEYVFSVRSNDRFEYFEEVRFKIRRKERAQVKVAVKIPPVKDNYKLEGVLEIQLQNLKPICLSINARCEVPQIVCVKDLFKPDEGCHMIKVPAKKNQIRMPPIPFKNLSNFNFTLEVQAITNENFSDRPYDIMSQNFVNCQANMQFFVNLQLKENMNYKGNMPVRDNIRKILVLKIKNSSVYFNYPLEVNVFESSNAGGMS